MTELAPPVPHGAVRPADLVTQAAAVARHAASAAHAEITLAQSQVETRAAMEVLAQVWTADRVLPLTPELGWALLHAGNYVALARYDGKVIGAAVAFRGYDERG